MAAFFGYSVVVILVLVLFLLILAVVVILVLVLFLLILAVVVVVVLITARRTTSWIKTGGERSILDGCCRPFPLFGDLKP